MKLFYMIFVLLLIPWSIGAQNKHSNYICTKTFIGRNDSLTTIEYFDGLGRNSEKVKKGYSDGGNKDLVSLVEYDGMGCEQKSWNPTPFSSTGNAIKPNVFQATAKDIHKDSAPYSEYEYDRLLVIKLSKKWDQAMPGSKVPKREI